MTDPAENSELQAALQKAGLTVTAAQFEKLSAYCAHLWELSRSLNLTRHLDAESFVQRDLRDCLSLAEVLPGDARILDIGSGGGVPGIILAILRPDLKITLAESIRKKSRALESLRDQVGLQLDILPRRAEDVLREDTFDAMTARAVAPLKKFLTFLKPAWSAPAALYLIKGPRWPQEVADAEEAGLLKDMETEVVAEWSTPGHDGSSVLAVVRYR